MKKVGCIALFLALTLTVVGWIAYSQRTPQAQAPSSAPAEHQSDAPAQAQVADLENALNSADGKTQLDSLAPSLRESYKGLGKDRFLPESATLKVKPETLVSSGKAANVDATLSAPNTPSAVVTLILVRNDTNQPWQLLDFKQK